MATSRGSGGRKSRGPRKTFIVRVPVDLAQTIEDEADSRGMYLSDYIGTLLAKDHGRAATLPERKDHDSQQGTLDQLGA